MVASARTPLNPPAARLPRVQPIWADIPAFTAFAHEVEQVIEEGELTYSKRLKLLGRAKHFEIRRFDANLIIAMVQNRYGDHPIGQQEPAPKSRFFTPLVVFSIVQAIILIVGWMIIRTII